LAALQLHDSSVVLTLPRPAASRALRCRHRCRRRRCCRCCSDSACSSCSSNNGVSVPLAAVVEPASARRLACQRHVRPVYKGGSSYRVAGKSFAGNQGLCSASNVCVSATALITYRWSYSGWTACSRRVHRSLHVGSGCSMTCVHCSGVKTRTAVCVDDNGTNSTGLCSSGVFNLGRLCV
jgi:hypothetical protein